MARASLGSSRRQAASGAQARSGRLASIARPTSESGAEQHDERAGWRAAACAPHPRAPHLAPLPPLLPAPPPLSPPAPTTQRPAMVRGVLTGWPRSPRRWVSVTSRHSDCQPTPAGTPAPRPRVSTVTRGAGGRSRPAAPRGARRVETGPPGDGAWPGRRGRPGAGLGADGEGRPEDRRDARRSGGLDEPDRAMRPSRSVRARMGLAVLDAALPPAPPGWMCRSASKTLRRRAGGRSHRSRPCRRDLSTLPCGGDAGGRATGSQVDEGLGLPEQVVGLARSQRSRRRHQGCAPWVVAQAGGLELSPLGQLRGHRRQERPEAGGPGTPAAARAPRPERPRPASPRAGTAGSARRSLGCGRPPSRLAGSARSGSGVEAAVAPPPVDGARPVLVLVGTSPPA